MLRVSVLMAAYNAERYIDKAIESLLNQTYGDWELIVVDDGSTDKTITLVEEKAALDSRIRYYSGGANRGVGPSRQKALECARGVYAAVLDADDMAFPEWLISRVDYLDRHPDVVAISGSRAWIDANEHRLNVTNEKMSPEVLLWRLLFGSPINDPSSVYRVAEARLAGGYSEVPYLAGWDLFTRLSTLGRIVQDDMVFVMYRVHSENASSRLGTDFERLKPLVNQIMTFIVRKTLGLDVPEDLVWYLFRGRYPYRGDPEQCERAVQFLLESYKVFLERYAVKTHAALCSAVLEDAANVLRCGGRRPKEALKTLKCVLAGGGLHRVFSAVTLRSMAKLVSVPWRDPSLYRVRTSG
jgi:glycosyltransferase involved in cell wall biosynthesis